MLNFKRLPGAARFGENISQLWFNFNYIARIKAGVLNYESKIEHLDIELLPPALWPVTVTPVTPTFLAVGEPYREPGRTVVTPTSDKLWINPAIVLAVEVKGLMVRLHFMPIPGESFDPKKSILVTLPTDAHGRYQLLESHQQIVDALGITLD